jgi:hypothetical protein
MTERESVYHKKNRQNSDSTDTVNKRELGNLLLDVENNLTNFDNKTAN